MGTTRIKVIDLSSDKKQIKTSRKHAEKLTGPKALEKERQKIRPKEVPEEKELAAADQPKIPEKVEGKPKEESPKPQKIKKSKKTAKQTHHLGAKYKKAKSQVENRLYKVEEALNLLPNISYTKFDPSVEVHLQLVEKNIRAKVNYPHPVTSKKENKVLIFSQKVEGVKNVIWGDEKTISDIESGKLKPNRDFDIVFSTPKFMPQLAKIAKILGPKGMMPNPKTQTVIDKPESAFEKNSEGTIEYKTEPSSAIIHAKIGKLSAKEKALQENLKALVLAVGPSKIKKATIASTMSPAIKIDPQAFT